MIDKPFLLEDVDDNGFDPVFCQHQSRDDGYNTEIEMLQIHDRTDSRRKKLMLPQPKEEKDAAESKEIIRLRKLAPLRDSDVKERYFLDRRCTVCRKMEHLHGAYTGVFGICLKCKYRYDIYCSQVCQKAHWPIHKEFCSHYKWLMWKLENDDPYY